MAKRTLNLTGTEEKVYDLDKIAEETRDNSSKDLIVQVYHYNVNLGESANPEKPKVGQI
jgi:hypothetical protein